MKWLWNAAFVLTAATAAVSAQSGKSMTTTYTGCVEAVNHGAWYVLTHVGVDREMMTDHDADRMMPAAVVLAGRSDLKKHVGQKVTVTGSVSHGMSQTMPSDRDTLTVASLKVLAKACSAGTR